MKIFSGSSNKLLAEKISRKLDLDLSPVEIFIFPDGEKRIQIQEEIVDEDCYVVQSTATPVDQNYMELFFIVDGLKRSGAKNITVIMPYLGYQRQDHVFRSGEAVSLDVVVHALERTGVTKVITFDLHSIKIPEVFSVPVVHLSALSLFAEKIKELTSVISNDSERSPGDFSSSSRNDSLLDRVLVSPDMGGLRRISKMSELLSDMPWIATVKDRDLDTGEIVINSIEGQDKNINLKGKIAFIVDDMISSGGTIVKSAELMKDKGVEKIFAFATHAIFSEEASTALRKSLIEKIFVTDSVFVPQEKEFSKLEIISISEMIARELKA